MFLKKHKLVETFIIILIVISSDCTELQEEEISRWAKELGSELWNLGKTITKFTEIQANYGFLNAQVEQKNPGQLLADVVKDIERMMDRKMDAIRCIQQEAEKLAELFEFNRNELNVPLYQYYSSKYSQVDGQPVFKLDESIRKNRSMYKKLYLNNDTHFYNLAVNTTHSSVHVPTNIYDRHYDAAFAIQWSEKLDDVFNQNYKSDPALSWQYFGSTTGVMRHYPAKKWEDIRKDLFDCRIRTWFIEAATCTKDVLLLVDNSGSMDGMGKHIAALTVYSILETFSNNDYINVLYYNETTNYTIPCFESLLVQATKENIKLFKRAIQTLKPAGKTRLSQALETAFEILADYRAIRGCNDTNRECNQAIMVITDGISKNLSSVVMKYNHLAEGLDIPVRIFTYLIGKEVTNVAEIQWMACANRGFHTHVQSLEQVTASVLEYINVIARPLVLQAEQHPPSWTHAYVDLTYDDKYDDQINEPYRLLTSVAVPAFDTKANKNNETRMANLLGVAGTDVPIADIEKLILPYKIGVNAYSFIVSNNGYVLMHPDLRPVFEGKLTENYNSIDLTEVEQLDNDLPPREIHDSLLNLRNRLVNGSRGSIHNVPVKYHYDDMKRIFRESYDYYFAPLKATPFSIAFAIPNSYGNYSLHVGDEISKNRHTGAKITDFFRGENWKIHSKWVYCKYHYLEGHEFKTPEKELLHFLEKMYDPDFTWEKQYEATDAEEENLDHVECGRKTHEDDDYYCDRQLVQRLVFDAKNTMFIFHQDKWTYQHGEVVLFVRFNATLRFIATMSGLTRWEYLNEEVENGTKKEFGDYHSKAIDETWYKSAVFQHQFDPESFVYSVPFNKGLQDDLLVTASYAIFPNDAGFEAPGSVVGFQFGHKNLKQRFQEISSKISKQCGDDTQCGSCTTTLECFIIDNNGYIILSDDNNDTGTFFGEIAGDIMDSMLNESIFDRVIIYDFQAICNTDDDIEISAGCYLQTPILIFDSMFNWLVIKATWLIFDININNLWQPFYAFAQDILDDFSDNSTTNIDNNSTLTEDYDGDEDDDEDADEDYEADDDDEEEKYYACEKQRNIFILRQHLFSHDNYPVEIRSSKSRPYFVKKIPYSNLLFVAVNKAFPVKNIGSYTTRPQKIVYENDTVYPCQKLTLNNMMRRRLTGCFNEHPLEHEIKACGRSAPTLHINFVTIIFGFISNCILYLNKKFH